MVAVGGPLFLIGSGRLVLEHRFDFIDALYCLLAVIPAGLLLLVFAYVLDHARLVSVLPLFVAGLLVFSSPVFGVALGLAMMGAAGPALKEWKDEGNQRRCLAAKIEEASRGTGWGKSGLSLVRRLRKKVVYRLMDKQIVAALCAGRLQPVSSMSLAQLAPVVPF
jgi:hypothetical protein